MTEVKTFVESIRDSKSDCYSLISANINKYAEENSLYVQSIHYDRLNDAIIANVVFSIIPKEMWLL